MEQRNPNGDRAYRAVFFDLDGTLLPMDVEEFMGAYMKKLGAFFAQRGVDPQQFGAAMKAGIKAMAHHSGDITNDQAFFKAFYECVDEGERDWMAQFMEFYETEFPSIGDTVTPNPAAARAVEALAAKGYTLVLTTMPMFPLVAVQARLKWAGVDPALFSRITSFENSASIKPNLTYYAENLAATGLAGRDVLMVGNNTVEDLAALDMGTDAYLVTDFLIDAVDYDLATVKHGSLADFAAWAEALPSCAEPAAHVETDAVSWPRVEKAYGANVLIRRSAAEMQRLAASAYSVNADGVPTTAKRPSGPAPAASRPAAPAPARPAAPEIARPSSPKEA